MTTCILLAPSFLLTYFGLFLNLQESFSRTRTSKSQWTSRLAYIGSREKRERRDRDREQADRSNLDRETQWLHGWLIYLCWCISFFIIVVRINITLMHYFSSLLYENLGMKAATRHWSRVIIRYFKNSTYEEISAIINCSKQCIALGTWRTNIASWIGVAYTNFNYLDL